MNLNKKLIALISTLFILLPSCSITEKDDKNTTAITEETISSEDLKVFKVYDYIEEKERFYILEENTNETYGTKREGSLKREARTLFQTLLSEDYFLNSTVTKNLKSYYNSYDLGSVIILINDITLENEELGMIAKVRTVNIQDIDNHIHSIIRYWNIIENGISKQFISFSKDENGEYIIDQDAIVVEIFELPEGEYTKDEVLEKQEQMNNKSDLRFVKNKI